MASSSQAQIAKPGDPPTILFCGKHRVNFALYQPVYQYLRRAGGARLLLSSGRYRKWPLIGWIPPRDRELYNEAVFSEFDIDPAHLHKTSSQDKLREYDVCVTSNIDKRIFPEKSRWKVQIFQGVSFRNFAVNEKYRRFDKLFFIGRYHLEQYLERKILKPNDRRIELIGMPKLDRLVDGTFDRARILQDLGLDPARPTVLWCPTGARHNGFDMYGHKGLRAMEAAGANVILKLHDHPHLKKGVTFEEHVAQAKAGESGQCRVETHSDVAPFLAAADLLVTDASSVAFEYCILDRPIVFIDCPKLLSERAAMEGCAMDLETHGRKIGRVVSSREELTETIKAELANPGELSPLRRAAAQHLFHDPGNATRRAAEKLIELAHDKTKRPSAS